MELVLITLFLLGLAIGSFLNVVIDRGLRGERMTGRSYCESCGKTLTVWELLPIFSFVIQKGRCRACGIVLSLQYPLVELATGLSFAIAAWTIYSRVGFAPSSVVILFFVAIAVAAGIVIFVTDLKSSLIPNVPVLLLGFLGLVFTLLRSTAGGQFILWNLGYDIGGALGIALFFFLLWFLSRGRMMGFGDSTLVFTTSLLIGFPTSIVAFLFSFWVGAIFGIVLLLLGFKSLKDKIPFGPFILIGTILAFFFSHRFLVLTGLITIKNLF